MRHLRPTHFDAVCDLLALCALPTTDLEPHEMIRFLGVFAERRLLAVGGIEVLGAEALLRSVAVHPSVQGKGLGKKIVSSLEDEARDLGIGDLYLLTDTADAYFARLGYEQLPRAEAPAAIAGSTQFARLCPASARLMRKHVGGA